MFRQCRRITKHCSGPAAECGVRFLYMENIKLYDLLNKDEVRGKIIRDAARLEDTMGLAITFYFTTNKRYSVFEELVLNRLGFEAKVSILEKIPYKKKYKSLDHLSVIRHLQRVRNIVAHDWHVSDYPKKMKSESWSYLFEDWPVSYEKAVKKADSALGRILNTNELLDHFALNRKKT